MSRRASIANALAEALKVIDGTGPYKTNLFGNSYAKLKFWDEISDFPAVYVVAGAETREYQPSAFTWCFLNVALKVYTKGEDPQALLEDLLDDIEKVIDANRVLTYDTVNNYETTEILITSISTDEGLMSTYGYGIGDVLLQVRYAKM